MAAVPKVLFVMGTSRCGSTILDNVLGEIDGFFSAGEIRFLWDRILQERYCGCGRPVLQCPIWSAVIEELSGQTSPHRWAGEINENQNRSAKLKHTLRLLSVSAHRAHGGTHLGPFLRTMQSLYEVVARVTGARVIVDSSKRPSNSALLRLMDNVDPFIIHLVRDPRAVAYSQAQLKENPDRVLPSEMPRTTAMQSMVHWNSMNSFAELVRARHGRRSTRLLRYEDFVAEPRAVVKDILDLVDEPDPKLPFEDARTVPLGVNHTVSGNPSRFRTGPVEIRRDDRWMARLPRRDRVATSILGMPLIFRYRYPLITHRAAAD